MLFTSFIGRKRSVSISMISALLPSEDSFAGKVPQSLLSHRIFRDKFRIWVNSFRASMRQSFSIGSQSHDDYVSVPAKYKSRLVRCGNFETTKGLRTDSRAGDVDSRNMVCSLCARFHSFMRFLRTKTFKGKRTIEFCCTVSHLKAFGK